jgi:hypothetical protein
MAVSSLYDTSAGNAIPAMISGSRVRGNVLRGERAAEERGRRPHEPVLHVAADKVSGAVDFSRRIDCVNLGGLPAYLQSVGS